MSSEFSRRKFAGLSLAGSASALLAGASLAPNANAQMYIPPNAIWLSHSPLRYYTTKAEAQVDCTRTLNALKANPGVFSNISSQVSLHIGGWSYDVSYTFAPIDPKTGKKSTPFASDNDSAYQDKVTAFNRSQNYLWVKWSHGIYSFDNQTDCVNAYKSIWSKLKTLDGTKVDLQYQSSDPCATAADVTNLADINSEPRKQDFTPTYFPLIKKWAYCCGYMGTPSSAVFQYDTYAYRKAGTDFQWYIGANLPTGLTKTLMTDY